MRIDAESSSMYERLMSILVESFFCCILCRIDRKDQLVSKKVLLSERAIDLLPILL